MFAIRFRSHLRMLRTMDTLDLSFRLVCVKLHYDFLMFRAAFNISPPIRLYSLTFLISTVIVMMIPLFYRIFEIIKEDSSAGTTR
jgi:hypothetical protein